MKNFIYTIDSRHLDATRELIRSKDWKNLSSWEIESFVLAFASSNFRVLLREAHIHSKPVTASKANRDLVIMISGLSRTALKSVEALPAKNDMNSMASPLYHRRRTALRHTSLTNKPGQGPIVSRR
jgi:hypothetical protein